jgi:ribosomal protein S18 acetylase RimI-like enzyme
VTALYKALAEDENSIVLVATENDKVVGFAAFCKDIRKLYRVAALKYGIRFAGLLGRQLLSWSRIKKLLGTMFYPFKKNKLELPDAELLATAISEDARGRGIGAMLVQEGLAECRKRGIRRVKVLVAADNLAANKLYSKCGFSLVCQIESHGILSNICVVDLA